MKAQKEKPVVALVTGSEAYADSLICVFCSFHYILKAEYSSAK